MILEIREISKNYGSQKALNVVSHQFYTCGVVGLIGPNGAGKSTLMKIITGYLTADSGYVEVLGDRVAVDSITTKSNVGYLPEHNPLYLDMYVVEYLEFVAATYAMSRSQRAVAVKKVIQSTGLEIEQHKRIGQLSKGYRQRVGIAAAIINSPKVLILDEPTTGLDPNQLVEIRELIAQLGREHLVIFSTHIMQEVETLCSHIIVLNRGSVVVDDSIDSLKNRYDSIENLFYQATH